MWGSCHTVTLDGGFCVLEAMTALREKGMFASALIVKCKHGPKCILGDEITSNFQEKDVSHSDACIGKLNGVPFHLHATKEPDCMMQSMSTHGALE